jgi:succinate dehydrogenase hydrophobic anchor subunit
MDEFDLKLFIDFFFSKYYIIILSISIGLNTFIDTLKHPLENNWNSPLQGNVRGIFSGIGFIALGVISMFAHLSGKDYPWLHDDIENATWEKYTALTILLLSLGRLIYLFFIENFREKEGFRLVIVLLCCVVLIVISSWNLFNLS